MARAVIAVAFLDLFMQFPVIGPYAKDLGATLAFTGVIVAAYSFTNLIGNLLAGVILDRWGRTIPLQVGLLCTAIALIGYVIASSPSGLLLARAFHGMSAAMLAPAAFAIIGDTASASDRVRIMGRSSAPVAAAALVGPMIGAFLGRAAGYPSVFALSAMLMFGMFLAFWIFSRRENRPTQDQDTNNETQIGIANLDYSRLIIACIAALSMTIGLGALVTHLPISLIAQGEASSASGPPFTTFALVATLIMASPLTLLADRRGRFFSLSIGLLLITGGLFFLSIFNGMFAAITGMAIFGAGFGLLFPTMVTVVTESSSSLTRGRAFGFFYAVYSLGVVIGSAASGTLADIYGETSGTPFSIGAVATLAAVLVILLVLRFVPKALEREAI